MPFDAQHRSRANFSFQIMTRLWGVQYGEIGKQSLVGVMADCIFSL